MRNRLPPEEPHAEPGEAETIPGLSLGEGPPGPEEVAAANEARLVVVKVLRTLPVRYLEVLFLRFFEDLTLVQIADDLHVSRERIRQIEARALRMLRTPSRAKILAACTDETWEEMQARHERRAALLLEEFNRKHPPPRKPEVIWQLPRDISHPEAKALWDSIGREPIPGARITQRVMVKQSYVEVLLPGTGELVTEMFDGKVLWVGAHPVPHALMPEFTEWLMEAYRGGHAVGVRVRTPMSW